jgi:hypothetical protein
MSGLVFEEQGEVTNAVILDVMGGRIAGVRVVANPEKLAHMRLIHKRSSGLAAFTTCVQRSHSAAAAV